MTAGCAVIEQRSVVKYDTNVIVQFVSFIIFKWPVAPIAVQLKDTLLYRIAVVSHVDNRAT